MPPPTCEVVTIMYSLIQKIGYTFATVFCSKCVTVFLNQTLNYLAFNTGFFLNYRYIEVENLLRKLKAKYTLSFIYLDFVQYITIGRKTAGILSKRRQ